MIIFLSIVEFQNAWAYNQKNEENNFYIGIKGAFSKYPEYKPKPQGGKLAPIGIDFIKPGFAVIGTLGYLLNSNFRAEAELTYRRHIFDKFLLIRDFPEKNFIKGASNRFRKKIWVRRQHEYNGKYIF